LDDDEDEALDIEHEEVDDEVDEMLERVRGAGDEGVDDCGEIRSTAVALNSRGCLASNDAPECFCFC